MAWLTVRKRRGAGVTQDQTLPTLIVSAAPYIGREMTEPEILTKRAVLEGQVAIGPATVVEMPAVTPTASGTAKPGNH